MLSGLVYQMAALGVDAENAPPAEALATALSEVALGAAAALSYEAEVAVAEVAARRAARDEQRRREVLQASLEMGDEDSDIEDVDASGDDMVGLPDAAADGRTAPPRSHAHFTGPSDATT